LSSSDFISKKSSNIFLSLAFLILLISSSSLKDFTFSFADLDSASFLSAYSLNLPMSFIHPSGKILSSFSL
jgi:hypothetical protein